MTETPSSEKKPVPSANAAKRNRTARITTSSTATSRKRKAPRSKPSKTRLSWEVKPAERADRSAEGVKCSSIPLPMGGRCDIRRGP